MEAEAVRWTTRPPLRAAYLSKVWRRSTLLLQCATAAPGASFVARSSPTLAAPLPRSPLLASRAENPAADKPEKELPSYMRGTAASKNAKNDRAKAHTEKMTATTGVESRKQNGRV